jgi:hypothetical protein
VSVGRVSKDSPVRPGSRPLFALIAAVLLVIAVLAVSADGVGSFSHSASQVTGPGTHVPARVPSDYWQTGSTATSSVQSACSPTAKAAADCVGFAVSVYGKTAVVAAPGTKGKAGDIQLYDYVRLRGGEGPEGYGWVKEATIHDPRNLSDDEYAWATAVYSTASTTYIAVGGNDNNGQRDFVYIYTGSGTTWRLQAKIGDPGTTFADMFGDSLALSGSTLVIGASCLDYDSGAAYVYQRSGASWVLKASMRDPLDREGDFYGQSVALSGNNVLIGSVGQAYVYTRTSAGKWPLTDTLHNPTSPQADFGNSVAISGSTVVIGAPGGAPGSGAIMPGAAYLYRKTGSDWASAGKLTAPSGVKGDEFGFAVAMTTPNMLIGMPLYDTKTNCGTAFAYKQSGGKWVLESQLKDPSCTAGASFGYAIEFSGTSVFAGAPGTDKFAGAAYALTIP